MRKLKLVGIDGWDRPVYKDEQGNLWKDINLGNGTPYLHNAVNNDFEGEPDSPMEGEYEIVETFYPEASCETCDNLGWETESKVAACNVCANYSFYTPRTQSTDDSMGLIYLDFSSPAYNGKLLDVILPDAKGISVTWLDDTTEDDLLRLASHSLKTAVKHKLSSYDIVFITTNAPSVTGYEGPSVTVRPRIINLNGQDAAEKLAALEKELSKGRCISLQQTSKGDGC